MKEVLNVLVTNFISSGVIAVLLYFILTKWLGSKIEQTVELKKDKELEDFKARLIWEYNELAKKRDRDLNSDSKLFNSFVSDFSPDGYIQVIRNTSGRIFHVDLSDFLDRLVYTWLLVDHEFLNEEIDSARIKMVNHAEEFAINLAQCTHSMPDKPDRYEIPLEWKIQDYENYTEVLKLLYAYRDHFVQAYDDFVRIAHSKLNCAL